METEKRLLDLQQRKISSFQHKEILKATWISPEQWNEKWNRPYGYMLEANIWNVY